MLKIIVPFTFVFLILLIPGFSQLFTAIAQQDDFIITLNLGAINSASQIPFHHLALSQYLQESTLLG